MNKMNYINIENVCIMSKYSRKNSRTIFIFYKGKSMSFSFLRPAILNYSIAYILLAGIMRLSNTHCQEKPNVIYILADDLGYGDLSCYGQKKFLTPNIDRLAQRGIKFTDHYSGSTVSAPSRSCLMTGQHTGHTPIKGNGKFPLPASSVTVAELFKAAGYTTGQFGKWGLGEPGSEGDPNTQGFDEFFGYIDQARAHRYYVEYLIDNGQRHPLPGNNLRDLVTYSADVIQEKALDFIEDNNDKPFYMYCSYTIPHAELIVPQDSIFQKFDGKFNPEKVHNGADYIGQNTSVGGYCSQKKCHATFAAMVYRLDLYVGQIVTKLEEHGILDSTIIMFTSDNGPHNEGGAAPNYFASRGGLRGLKRDLYEAGIRVPFIVSWPGKISQGKESNHISAFWDFLPTCADLINQNMPQDIDGISFLPELLGQPEQPKHDFLYWEFFERNGRRAARMGKWKAVQYKMKDNPYAAVKLFNLKNDRAEQNDIASNYKDTVANLLNIMEMSHLRSKNFSWAYESKKIRATFVLMAHGKPVGGLKVNLKNNGDRISWKNGQAVYTGVTKSAKPELKIYENNQVLFTKDITVQSKDIIDTINLSTVAIFNNGSNSELPRPFSIQIESKKIAISSKNTIKHIELVTVQGKVILVQRANNSRAIVDLTKIPSGLYVLKINGQMRSSYSKIIVGL